MQVDVRQDRRDAVMADIMDMLTEIVSLLAERDERERLLREELLDLVDERTRTVVDAVEARMETQLQELRELVRTQTARAAADEAAMAPRLAQLREKLSQLRTP